MVVPGLDQQPGKLPHRLDQERARAHGGVADLERQDGLGRRVRPEPAEDRLQRLGHDRPGERPGRVVRPGPPPLGAGLEDQRAGRHRGGREPAVDQPVERRDQVGLGAGIADRRGGGRAAACGR